jgi:hypothetical protein
MVDVQCAMFTMALDDLGLDVEFHPVENPGSEDSK